MMFLLALAAASQPSLEDTTWTLTSLSFGADTIAPGCTMTLPTLQIMGGTVTGSTGCSVLKANIRVRGQALLFCSMNAGKNDFCPDHVLSLRDDFATLLAQATRYAVRDGQLTVYAGEGRLNFRVN